MTEFQLTFLEADSPFYEGPCESLIVPTTEGQYGIQANHYNIIAAIVPGELHYKIPGQPFAVAAVSQGLVKVENNEVLILVDSAEHPEEIDIKRAERAAAAAKEILLQQKSIKEYHAAEAQLARAFNRMKIKEKN